MKNKLAMLVDLQGIDDALRDLREARRELAELEKENKVALEGFDTMIASLRARIEETRGFHAEKEEEIRETESNIGRSKTRLNSITSQKELTALNKELESARKNNQLRNEELGKLQEQLVAAQGDLDAKTVQRVALAQQMGEVESAMKARITEKLAGLTDLDERRAAIQKQLPRDLFAKYERISKARNGLAVADVPGSTCAGCNMAVPPQVYIRLQRMETFEQCANCSRILVYRRGLVDDGQVGLSE